MRFDANSTFFGSSSDEIFGYWCLCGRKVVLGALYCSRRCREKDIPAAKSHHPQEVKSTKPSSLKDQHFEYRKFLHLMGLQRQVKMAQQAQQ